VAGADPHVLERLEWLSGHVRRLVAAGISRSGDANDPYLGLYVSDQEAVDLASESGDRASASAVVPPPSIALPPTGTRIGDLAAAFTLDVLDLDLLIIAVACDLEPRFERLFGYLHDDLTRRRPSVGLALELSGHGFADPSARARFGADGPLVRHGLVAVEEPRKPFLSRPLSVSDRVVDHLLGIDAIETAVARLRAPSVVVDLPGIDSLARMLASGVSPVYVQDGRVGTGAAFAASALAAAGLEALTIDLVAGGDDDAVEVCRAAVREARLRMCGLVVMLDDDRLGEHRRALHALAVGEWPTIVIGMHPWDPLWSNRPVVSLTAPDAPTALTGEVWSACLPDVGFDLRRGTRQFHLRPDQIVNAATLARRRAEAESRPIVLDDVAAGARAQNSSRLERLATRVAPEARWGDLVLPDDVLTQLRELAERYANRDLVHGDWGMGGSANRRVGVVSLFAGPSGVGKTLAAEALAGSLQLDLYRVNLATVVDKYIGETEKNLERIFVAAEGVNGVIFFDEADALFGKRSEVSDAKDRYANVEVAYLLQRLESFGGVAILATNLRTNVDEAFTRRLDALIDFPEPDVELRRRLWDRCLGTKVPRNGDLDLDFLAERFRLSGGNIRNVAVSAAFLAASKGSAVSMPDLVVSTAREYRKLGRLCTAQEFGSWLDLALGRVVA
jgi:hypothetical protein